MLVSKLFFIFAYLLPAIFIWLILKVADGSWLRHHHHLHLRNQWYYLLCSVCSSSCSFFGVFSRYCPVSVRGLFQFKKVSVLKVNWTARPQNNLITKIVRIPHRPYAILSIIEPVRAIILYLMAALRTIMGVVVLLTTCQLHIPNNMNTRLFKLALRSQVGIAQK